MLMVVLALICKFSQHSIEYLRVHSLLLKCISNLSNMKAIKRKYRIINLSYPNLITVQLHPNEEQ